MDTLSRCANSSQTVGIPIGPDTSRLVAEVILGRVDSELALKHSRLSGIRYIDDYEFVTRTRSEAESVLADLQQILHQYELALNPRKTALVELPTQLEPTWTSQLRIFPFRDAGVVGQRNDLIAYFDRAFALTAHFPDDGVLKYAVGRLRGVEIDRENWPLLEDLLNQAILVEPPCIPQVCEEVRYYRDKRFRVRKELWGQSLNSIICEQLPLGNASEAAWAMWLLKLLPARLQQRAAKHVGACEDSVASLMGLGLAELGLAQKNHLAALSRHAGAKSLTEEQWLLCYQGNLMGWLPGGGRSVLKRTPPYDYLENRNVSFFDIGVALPPPTRYVSTGGGGSVGGGY